MKSGS